MYNTLNYLKTIRKENLKTFTNNSLAFKYQQQEDDSIIAEIFIKNFAFLIRLSNQAYTVDMEDKASLILNSIHKTLVNFDGSHSFLTLLGTIIRNEFGRYRILNKFKNRSSITVSLNNISVDDREFVDMVEDNSSMQDLEYRLLVNDLLKIKSLSASEKRILMVMIKYPDASLADIAKKLGLCNVFVGKTQKKIKIKLKGYFFS